MIQWLSDSSFELLGILVKGVHSQDGNGESTEREQEIHYKCVGFLTLANSHGNRSEKIGNLHHPSDPQRDFHCACGKTCRFIITCHYYRPNAALGTVCFSDQFDVGRAPPVESGAGVPYAPSRARKPTVALLSPRCSLLCRWN